MTENCMKKMRLLASEIINIITTLIFLLFFYHNPNQFLTFLTQSKQKGRYDIECFKNLFLNIVKPFFAQSEPLGCPKIAPRNDRGESWEITLWDHWTVAGKLTLGEFLPNLAKPQRKLRKLMKKYFLN